MSLFDIEITAGDETATARLSGDVDMAVIAAIENRLQPVLDTEPATLVIDLGGVTFFDSSGLRLVLRLDRHQRELGCRLVIVPGPRMVARVFELTGIDKQLEFAPETEFPADPS